MTTEKPVETPAEPSRRDIRVIESVIGWMAESKEEDEDGENAWANEMTTLERVVAFLKHTDADYWRDQRPAEFAGFLGREEGAGAPEAVG